MPCSERRAGVRAWLRAALRAVALPVALLVALLPAEPALAHKSSDAYLQIDMAADRLDVRWDIALRDLDIALDLDADGDGKLTWGEVKAAWPRIDSYANARLAIAGCPLQVPARALERRNDGAYAVLRYTATCAVTGTPDIRYSLFADIDPTHRGIAKVQRPGEPPLLLVLDPARGAAQAPATSAPGASGAPPAAPAGAGNAGSPWQFLVEGVHHILGGYDHVLFLLCLLLPAVLRRTSQGWTPVDRVGQAIWPVAGIVTAFTIAHSITLGLAALKIVSLPSSFIEPAIAVTIMLAAADNLVPIFPVRRFVVAFAFGLIHGFGFASVLGELNLPAADFAWALLQFNLGLEFGQLMVVLVATALLFALRDWRRYRTVVVVGGSLVAIVIAGLWFVERTANLKILPF